MILELIAAHPEAKVSKNEADECIFFSLDNCLPKVAKAQVDKLVDIAARPPKGTGVYNLREAIIESKMTYDVSSDEWQVYLREKIMSNIERYFYLVRTFNRTEHQLHLFAQRYSRVAQYSSDFLHRKVCIFLS